MLQDEDGAWNGLRYWFTGPVSERGSGDSRIIQTHYGIRKRTQDCPYKCGAANDGTTQVQRYVR
jgi:hypothetical protein